MTKFLQEQSLYAPSYMYLFDYHPDSLHPGEYSCQCHNFIWLCRFPPTSHSIASLLEQSLYASVCLVNNSIDPGELVEWALSEFPTAVQVSSYIAL
jgi:hypothetical protein